MTFPLLLSATYPTDMNYGPGVTKLRTMCKANTVVLTTGWFPERCQPEAPTRSGLQRTAKSYRLPIPLLLLITATAGLRPWAGNTWRIPMRVTVIAPRPDQAGGVKRMSTHQDDASSSK